MPLRDVGIYARTRLSGGLRRWLTRGIPPAAPAPPLDDVLRGAVTPLALTALLEGRSNP
jgi:hypothetical protein